MQALLVGGRNVVLKLLSKFLCIYSNVLQQIVLGFQHNFRRMNVIIANLYVLSTQGLSCCPLDTLAQQVSIEFYFSDFVKNFPGDFHAVLKKSKSGKHQIDFHSRSMDLHSICPLYYWALALECYHQGSSGSPPVALMPHMVPSV